MPFTFSKQLHLFYFLGLLLFLLLPQHIVRADVVNLGVAFVGGSGSSITVPSGTTVAVCHTGTDTGVFVSSTLGGVSGTLIQSGTIASGNYGGAFWYLNPPSGSQVITDNNNNANSQYMCWFTSGADTSAPIDDFDNGVGTSASVTTTETDFIIGTAFVGGVTNSSPLTPSGVSYSMSIYAFVDSGATPVAVGSFTQTWSGISSHGWITAIKPTGSSTPPVPPTPVATSTISYIDIPTQDIFNGFIAFFCVMFGIIWLVRKGD